MKKYTKTKLSKMEVEVIRILKENGKPMSEEKIILKLKKLVNRKRKAGKVLGKLWEKNMIYPVWICENDPQDDKDFQICYTLSSIE